MRSSGNFGDNASVSGMKVNLAADNVRKDLSTINNYRCSSFVT